MGHSTASPYIDDRISREITKTVVKENKARLIRTSVSLYEEIGTVPESEIDSPIFVYSRPKRRKNKAFTDVKKTMLPFNSIILDMLFLGDGDSLEFLLFDAKKRNKTIYEIEKERLGEDKIKTSVASTCTNLKNRGLLEKIRYSNKPTLLHMSREQKERVYNLRLT